MQQPVCVRLLCWFDHGLFKPASNASAQHIISCTSPRSRYPRRWVMSSLFSFVWPSSSKDDHDEDHSRSSTSSAHHTPNRLYWSNSSTLHINTSMVSAPLPKTSPVSLTGFDGQLQPRKSPSTVAWLSTTDSNGEQIVTDLPIIPPPAVPKSQLGGGHLHPISRAASSPATSPSYSSPSPSSSSLSSSSPSSSSSTKLVPPRLQMNRALNHSTQSLRLDSTTFDRYGKKQLSPIAEQDYFSPESLRRSIPLPSISAELTPVSPSTNQSHNTNGSDITREYCSLAFNFPVLIRYTRPFACIFESIHPASSQ